MAEVAFIYCTDYEKENILAALRDLLEPWGGMRAFVSPGERVLLKPNLLMGKEPEKTVTTHPAVVWAAAYLVREAGARPMVGDSPSLGSYKAVAEKTGMTRVCQELNIPLLGFKSTVEMTQGKTFRRISLAKEALETEAIINLPKLKTHGMMTLTLAVKNLFGCVVGAEKAQWHLMAGVDKGAFARMLLDISYILRPRLNIIDGLWAMEGDGPSSGDKKFLGILGASPDATALDYLIAQHLSVSPAYIPTLALSADMNGEIKPRGVYLHPRARNLWGSFALPSGTDVEWGLPEFMKRGLKNHLTPKLFIDPQICLRCQDCKKVCPPQIIRWSTKSKAPALYIDQRYCIHCYCCQEVCPQGAVKVKEGFGGVLKKVLNRK